MHIKNPFRRLTAADIVAKCTERREAAIRSYEREAAQFELQAELARAAAAGCRQAIAALRGLT